MHAEYWREPSRVTREPWGMTQVGIRAISSIALVSTTETLLANGIAMQVEINHEEEIAVGRDVSRGREEAEADLSEDAIVVGFVFDGSTERPAVADGDEELLWSGEKAMPWGPLTSACRMRVSLVLSSFAPSGPKRTVAIRSELSQTSFTQ